MCSCFVVSPRIAYSPAVVDGFKPISHRIPAIPALALVCFVVSVRAEYEIWFLFGGGERQCSRSSGIKITPNNWITRANRRVRKQTMQKSIQPPWEVNSEGRLMRGSLSILSSFGFLRMPPAAHEQQCHQEPLSQQQQQQQPQHPQSPGQTLAPPSPDAPCLHLLIAQHILQTEKW